MACRGTVCPTEHDFVAQVVHERESIHTCCGPLIKQGFIAQRLARLEDSFQSGMAHDLLWAGFDTEPTDAMYFTLCALHWMELACLVSLRGHQFDDPALRSEGTILLSNVCATVGWDAKEIANAFTWQQVRLT